MLFQSTLLTIDRSHHRGKFLVVFLMSPIRISRANKILKNYYPDIPESKSQDVIFHLDPTELLAVLIDMKFSKTWAINFVDSVTKMND
jgi:hypothetical protein